MRRLFVFFLVGTAFTNVAKSELECPSQNLVSYNLIHWEGGGTQSAKTMRLSTLPQTFGAGLGHIG